MNNYEQYAIIDSKIKALTNQKDELKTKILEEMIESGEEKVKTSVGSFSKVVLKSWEYPEEVVKLGEEYKAAKASAESTGDATFTESNSLRFVQIKL